MRPLSGIVLQVVVLAGVCYAELNQLARGGLSAYLTDPFNAIDAAALASSVGNQEALDMMMAHAQQCAHGGVTAAPLRARAAPLRARSAHAARMLSTWIVAVHGT